MFGSSILDAAIGLSLVYLSLSLIASGIQELIEASLKLRAKDLEKGIRNLLQDGKGEDLTATLYQHPLISHCSTGRTSA